MVRNRLRGAFERWGPAAFVVGGVGILGTSVVGSLDVAGVMQAPPRLAMGPLLFGLWFVFVGLLGFHRRVADVSPRLARGGWWTAGVAWAIWSATLLAALAVDVTTERTLATPGSWGPPLLTVAFVLALLGFLCYGVASVRTERPSRAVGVLLLLPVVAFLGQVVLLASKILTGEVVATLQLAFGALVAVALVTVGYRLRGSHDEVTTATAGADTTT
jgi:hypothetical protein